jgi:hypothetical protein
MKITAVLQAMALRFFVPSAPYGYLPETIQKIKARYGFAGAPTTIEELLPKDPNQGNLFRLGRHKINGRETTINELYLYHLGLAVSTNSSTDDSDLVLDDFLEWATSEFNIVFREHGKRTYTSQLEIQLDYPLPEYVPQLTAIGLSVPHYLSEFWLSRPPYEVSSITFGFDPATQQPALGTFRIERRQSIAYSANLYYSEAPTTTKGHIALLEAFEDLRR